jgi:hypothetical protein
MRERYSKEENLRESPKDFRRRHFRHFGVQRFESPEDIVKAHFGG